MQAGGQSLAQIEGARSPAWSADARLWFSFLPMVGEGSYDYAAWIGTQTRATGHPKRIHTDEGADEHGFVIDRRRGERRGVDSLARRSGSTVWLDGQAHQEAGGETSLLWLQKSGDEALWKLRRMAHGDTNDFVIAAVPAGRESGRARVLDQGTRVLVAVPGATGNEVRKPSFPHGSTSTKDSRRYFAAVPWRRHEGPPCAAVLRSAFRFRRLRDHGAASHAGHRAAVRAAAVDRYLPCRRRGIRGSRSRRVSGHRRGYLLVEGA